MCKRLVEGCEAMLEITGDDGAQIKVSKSMESSFLEGFVEVRS